MSRNIIILERSYPDREKMKKALEQRGVAVLSITQAVDHYFNTPEKRKIMRAREENDGLG